MVCLEQNTTGNRTRQRPGPDNDHTIWSFSGPEISGPDNDHTMWSFSGPKISGLDNDQSLCGPEILGPHNDVGKIVRSLCGPETPVKLNKMCHVQGSSNNPKNQHESVSEAEILQSTRSSVLFCLRHVSLFYPATIWSHNTSESQMRK